jgi:hypothetical protein
MFHLPDRVGLGRWKSNGGELRLNCEGKDHECGTKTALSAQLNSRIMKSLELDSIKPVSIVADAGSYTRVFLRELDRAHIDMAATQL